MAEVIRNFETRNKVKASSLIEVIVAMVILMLSFGLAISLFIKITESNRGLQQIKNRALVNSYIVETKRKQSYINTVENIDDIMLIRQVQLYKNNPTLVELTIELRSIQDSLLYRHIELVYSPTTSK